MKSEITYSFVAARTSFGLEQFGLLNGIGSDDTADFAAKVLGAVRTDIKKYATKALLTKSANGKEKRHVVKNHADKQKATGTKLLKLTNGSTEEWFIALCRKEVQALVRIDQGLLKLEELGAGIDWTPPEGSALRDWLLELVGEFKPATKTNEPAPATP